MYYIYTILLLAKLLFVRKTNETFGEDAMFVYLVRNYPCRNRVKYPLFRENIPLGLSTDKFSLYYTWRMREEGQNGIAGNVRPDCWTVDEIEQSRWWNINTHVS